MDQGVGATKLFGDGADLGQVARDELHGRAGEGRRLRGIPDEGDDLVTSSGELPDDRAADEPAAARDDDRSLSRRSAAQ